MAQPAAEVPARSLDFNEDGCSVRCKLYASNDRSLRGLVIYCHGFAGHKETKAAQRMARALMAKKKDWGLLVFDWPCHGQDGRKKLSLSDCLQYLDIVVRQARALWQPEELLACATSFGAYCLLNYLVRYGCPFGRIALRCPAIDMYTLLTGTILTPQELEKLEKGKPAEAGFDRLIRITPEFLEELREKASPLLLSDVGCASEAARSALTCAAMNVFANTRMLPDNGKAQDLAAQAESMLSEYVPRAQAVSDSVMGCLREPKT